MRDFSWKYFTLTGDVDAFLLYKEMDQLSAAGSAESQAELDAAVEAAEELAP